MKKNPTIAAFDFDGTLTQKDTFLEFIKFVHGNFKFHLGFLINSPLILLMKLKILSNERVKQLVFSYFFKGIKIHNFNLYSHNFKQQIENMLKESVINELKKHLIARCQIIIISASIENWIEPWAKSKGIEYLAGTQIEVVNDIVTGKFTTRNCYGQEKVNRLLKHFPNRKGYYLVAYGDSAGDRELLKFADESYLDLRQLK